jgi:hypothetical protein
MTDLKDRGINISISSFLSIASAVGVLWFFIQPVMVSQVSDAIKADIQSQIENEQRPMTNAFKAIIQNSINVNKRAIAKLEYDRDHAPDTWSAERARILADRYLEVQALERAYNEL